MAAEFQHVSGLRELQEALRELGPRVSRKVLRRAVVAAAKLVRDEAKANAPVWTGPVSKGHPPPGTLKRAISMGRSNRDSAPGKEVVNVFVRTGAMKKVKGGGKFDAYYWRYVELGTSRRAAHPFLRPAFEARKQDCIDAIKNTLAQGVEDEAAALRK